MPPPGVFKAQPDNDELCTKAGMIRFYDRDGKSQGKTLTVDAPKDFPLSEPWLFTNKIYNSRMRGALALRDSMIIAGSRPPRVNATADEFRRLLWDAGLSGFDPSIDGGNNQRPTHEKRRRYEALYVQAQLSPEEEEEFRRGSAFHSSLLKRIASTLVAKFGAIMNIFEEMFGRLIHDQMELIRDGHFEEADQQWESSALAQFLVEEEENGYIDFQLEYGSVLSENDIICGGNVTDRLLKRANARTHVFSRFRDLLASEDDLDYNSIIVKGILQRMIGQGGRFLMVSRVNDETGIRDVDVEELDVDEVTYKLRQHLYGAR